MAVSAQYVNGVQKSISVDDVDKLYKKYILIFTIGRVPQGLDKLLLKFKNAVKIHFVCYERSGYISKTFLRDHIFEFKQTMAMLSDDFSRSSLYLYIKASIQHDASVIIPSFVSPTYFQRDIVSLDNIEHFVDCGVFNGGTIYEFYQYTDCKNARITAYEPEEHAYEKLRKYVETLSNSENIVLFKKGVFSKNDRLKFDIGGNDMTGMLSNEGTLSVEVVSIDETVSVPVSFIKADIEGAELDALKGAKQTILRDKPTLAFSLYHKEDDAISLVQYIRFLVPEYKLYVRNHTYNLNDMVLYATI